jgi:hypothetical protein
LTDSLGHVALRSTVGYGAAPPVVVQHVDQVDEAVDLLSQLPKIGAATGRIDAGGGGYVAMQDAAARGIYAYDWIMWHGPYQRLASPTKPLSVDELPPPIKRAAQLVRISVPLHNAELITEFKQLLPEG